MKPLTLAVLASAVLGPAALACGAGARGATDPGTVVVPAQPPQPTAAPSAAPLALPIATAPSPSFKCESGKRFEIGARSYCAYAEADAWEPAERRCVANGGHLMTLDSRTTSDAVHAVLGSPVGAGRAAWIGLELKRTGGRGGGREWTWISGETLTVASWNTGEPNDFDGNEACAEWLVADGRWNDTRCVMKQPYLCQAKADKALACKGGRAFGAGATAYCFNTVERSFADAKRACATDGGALATPRTTEENQAVREAMAARISATRMWIGLHDHADKASWSWVSGAELDLRAWKLGEPNDFNEVEDCVELFGDSWTWNDLDCNVRLPSVCESPARTR